jgi:hypothetical protein
MSRKLELLLREWGQFHIKHADHADEWGENTLYRAGVMGQTATKYSAQIHPDTCKR